MTIVMSFPVEGGTEEIIDGAHPVDRDSATAEGFLERFFFSRVFGEKYEVINVDPNVDSLAVRRRVRIGRVLDDTGVETRIVGRRGESYVFENCRDHVVPMMRATSETV